MQVVFAFALIAWGISIIAGTIFGFSIPFLRLFFAGLLIYFGMRMLSGNRSFFGCHTSYGRNGFNTWSYTTAHTTGAFNYKIYCNTQTIDLHTLQLEKKPTNVDIQTAFSNIVIILKPSVPTLITLNGAFTNIQLPSTQHTPIFQTEPNVYRTHEGVEAELVITVSAHCSNVELRFSE